MANENLAVRFTDESYASRIEVAKALGTNLIDSIWAQILNYRKQYRTNLKIYDIYKSPFYITLTSGVLEKIHVFEKHLNEIDENYCGLVNGSFEKENLENEILKVELKYLAQAKGTPLNDVALANIISGQNNNELYKPFVNYLYVLKSIDELALKEINANLLAEIKMMLEGNGDLISFYRTKDLSSNSPRVLINAEYNCAPVSQIEPLMEALFAHCADHDVNLATKICGICFAIDYIKPFENCNEEVAMILSKLLIAKAYGKETSHILPLEYIFTKHLNLANVSKETQKTKDLTYYLNSAIMFLDEALSIFNNKMLQISKSGVEKEFFAEEEVKPIINKPVEETVEPAPSKEVTVKEQVTPRKIEKVNEIITSKPKVDLNDFKELDEKALKRAAEDLLESDPMLRPSQAHFYVRHCTVGKYYTIQMFKKAEGCVYETARTSMDNLARNGYYRREQIKNKFVYTPISK